MQIYSDTSEAFSSSSQRSLSQGSTLACSLEISPPLLPPHHSPRWSPVPLRFALRLPLSQLSRSIWPMTRVRATTSLQVIWPPVKSRVQMGGSVSLTDPFLLVSSSDYHPANSSHIFPRFLLKGGIFLQHFLFLVKYPSTIQAAVSRFPLVRNTLCLPLLQNTTALISWVSKCCSPPLNPPPPAETSPPPQASPLVESQQGSREARLKPLPFTHQNQLPCTGGMVHSCQTALPL